MKIKLAIIDSDRNYLDRLSATITTKYSEMLEVYSFTDIQNAEEQVLEKKPDVIIASEECKIDHKKLPRRCAFAYFVESQGIESIKDMPAICKFQKVELIYKQVLGLYSEKAQGVLSVSLENVSCATVAFTSPCGGTGTTTVAMAAAVAFSKKGKRVFYLDYETFGISELYFSAEGTANMSDVIFSLKSKKSNIALKLESCMKLSPTGVTFFSQPKVALDMLELDEENALYLIDYIKNSGKFDVIVINMEFSMNSFAKAILDKVDRIVAVSDGTETVNYKFKRVYEALEIKEQDKDYKTVEKLCVMYNKFSNKGGQMLPQNVVRSIGGAPRYEHATNKQIVDQLSTMAIFEGILA